MSIFKTLSFSLILIIGIICTFSNQLYGQGSNQQFDAIVSRYFEESVKLNPIGATSMGDHRLDTEINDVSTAGRARVARFYREILSELDSFLPTNLSLDEQIDRALLQHRLRAAIWKQEELEEWAWNPLPYSGLAGSSIYSLMAREFAPLPERLMSAAARLEKLPTLYTQTRSELIPKRVPIIHAETAVKQNRGILSIIENVIQPHLDQLDEKDRVRLTQAIETAIESVETHQKWLENELLPQATGEFRIGARLYDQKLSWTLQSSLTREQIRKRGEAFMLDLHQRMYLLSKEIYKKQFPYTEFPESPSKAYQKAIIRSCLEIAYQNRPSADGVVAAANHSVKLTSDFLKEKDIITLPDDPMEIIVMPEFQRGVSLAYCDSPGPLETGLKTFYAVAPPPASWTESQVESHLREYNHRSLHNLTIHEAMPGHFVQLAHANRNPRKLRAVLSSGVFVEGWAVYSEWMMCEEGFLEGDLLMRLIVLKWYLRDVTNALLDQAVHVDGISKEEGMRMLVEKAFQEEREADGKWRRAQLTSAQLSTYFVGYLEHVDLRAEAEERWGSQFDLKTYHDRALSFGSIPTQYVRTLLFDLELQER